MSEFWIGFLVGAGVMAVVGVVGILFIGWWLTHLMDR